MTSNSLLKRDRSSIDKRAISIGIVVALIAYVAVRLILSTKNSVMQQIDFDIWLLLMSGLYLLVGTLMWLLGGVTVGYLCTEKPIKNGAVAGTLYGVVICLAGAIMIKVDPEATPFKLTYIGYPLTFIVQCAFLFTLSSCLGFLLRLGSNRSLSGS